MSREKIAGESYSKGLRAVTNGGGDLILVALHLIIMIKGTSEFPGALWRVRQMRNGDVFHLDRFIDYLLEPPRKGLGIPSLFFLRQVLEATPRHGECAMNMVRSELAKEHIDFDAVADREGNAARNATDKANPSRQGERTDLVYNIHEVKKRPAGTSVEATVRRLRKDWPDLHARWLAGELSANAAAIAAGFRRKLTPFEIIERQLPKLTAEERHKLKAMLLGNLMPAENTVG